MRKFLLILLVPLLLILLAAVLVPVFLDKDKLLELASTELQQQTGATLTVDGDVGLTLFPTLGVSLGDVGLDMPGEDQPDVQARSLEIGVQLMPLLSGQLEIESLAADGLVVTTVSTPSEQDEQPTINTSELSDAELDAFYEKRRRMLEEAGAASAEQSPLTLPLALNVASLSITDSRLERTDAKSNETTVVELQELKARGLNLDNRAIPLKLKLRLVREEPVELALDGKVQVSQQDQAVTLDKVQVIVQGATPQPVTLRTSGTVSIPNQVAELQLDLELAETRGAGTLRYASFESPQVDADLQLNLLNPALFALAGPEAAAGAERQPESDTGDSGDQPLPLDALRSIDTRARLGIEEAVFGAHTIEDMRMQLRAVDGIVQVNTLKGQLHGGAIDLKARFNAKYNTAKLTLTGSVSQLDIAAALAAVESEPVLVGKANLALKLKSQGATSNELLAAMKGPIKLTTEDAVLYQMEMEKKLCQAVALANRESLTADFPPDSPFKDLSVDIKVADGKAKLSPLRARLEAVKLLGTGHFDILSQDFKATFEARLSPALAKLDPACRVNERLTDIDWPVECEGNIGEDPADWCGVDSEEILEDMARNELERQTRKEVERKLGKDAGKIMDQLFK
jgi:uncharacterized protein involved in outer membrane biogenesis